MSAEKSSWERFGDNATLSRFRQRTIDNTVAPLRRYLGSGMTVLDVGCGPGALTLDAAAVVAPGAVAGIDLSRSAVSQAEESARAAGLSNVSFQVADAYSIPFEDGTFDLTYSHSILEYLREPSRALAEQVRVTKPGGRAIAAVLVTGGLIIYPPAPALLRLFHARFDYIGAHTPTTRRSPT
jgi:ubiquinone/menaquinone biosynthesis C-methylase UbiE